MNILLISKYINKLTKDDIKTFAYNKGILLEEYEIDIIYFYIKKYYKEFLQGNDLLILNKLKKEISKNTYNHIINLYNEYKRKINRHQYGQPTY